MDNFKVPFDVPQDLQLIQGFVGELPNTAKTSIPQSQPAPSSRDSDTDSNTDGEKEAQPKPSATDGFKVPSSVPQDLRLIQGIVGEEPTPPLSKTSLPLLQPNPPNKRDDIENDADSEKEVEDDILNGVAEEEDREKGPAPEPSDSISADSDSSDSDSEDDIDASTQRLMPDFDEEEDSGPAVSSDNPLRTKNELLESDIVIPEIDQVDTHEPLEKVGEVMSIVGQVAIVIGSPSHIINRANERALDSDTLLVFDDRKVFGYIYETFGPTSQPMYQIKFNQKYPLDPDKVRVGREVFHVPARSNFVFVSQIKRFKGSDASNAHDEEPADDELEFSDDEQEHAHRRALTQKRAGRSAASSRHATPTPSQMRDQDMADDPYSANSDGQRYNDMDFGAEPSRPAPMPYDDPYSDSYGLPNEGPSGAKEQTSSTSEGSSNDRVRQRSRIPPAPMGSGRFNDRGRGRGRGMQRDRGGRGRGRGRGRDHHGVHRQGSFSEEPEIPRPLSPTSLAIARATGQYGDSTMYANADLRYQNGWDYNQSQQPNFDFNFGGYQQTPYGVQPHINPRFASAFGLNLGMYPQQNQGMGGENYGYGAYGQGSDYTVPNHVPGTWPQTDNSGHSQS